MVGRKPKVNRDTSNFIQDGPVAFRIELGERIRSLLDEFGTRVEAAEIAGVTPEHLASYIGGRAKPPFELIARLAAAKAVSLAWLATGQGPRSNADAEPAGFVAVATQMEADARYDEDETEPASVLFSRPWLRSIITAPDDRLRLVIHRGNSNEPVIRDGDAMLVDTTIQRIADDGLYVFPRDGKYLAKFVETFIDGRVALKSRNPDYGVQMLSPDEAHKLQLLGRVCWRGGPI